MAALNALNSAILLLAAAASPAQMSGDWSSYVAEASARFGVPQEWIKRVIAAESNGREMLGGRPVTSRAGAMGLMQLMPRTWAEMRRLNGLGPDPYEPRSNILAGTAYLKSMYDRFGYPGLFAAYNAGPERYSEHLATGARLPSETISYLAKTSGAGPVAQIQGGAVQPGRSANVEARSPVAADRLFAVTFTPSQSQSAANSNAGQSLFVLRNR